MLLLSIIETDDVVSGINLLDMSVDSAEPFLPSREIFLRAFGDDHHKSEADEGGGDGGDCHDPVRFEHHEKAADKERRRGNDLNNAALKRVTDGVHIVCDAGEHVSEACFVVIIDWQTVDFLGDCTAQIFGDLLIDCRHNESLHKTEQPACRIESDERIAYA